MKRNGLILILLCAAMSLCAQNHRQATLNKMMLQLWREGKYIQALDSAVTLLSINGNHNGAKYFVYQHWEEAIARTNKRLSQLLQDDDLNQRIERVEIFKAMDEVYERIMQVPMPIEGAGWTWQPPLKYYTGHYDSERTEAFKLALRKADEAMQSYDVEEGKYCYELGLQRFLLTAGERESNHTLIMEKEFERLKALVQVKHLHKAIFAYELADYLLSQCADNEDISKELSTLEIKALQQQARETIISEYQKMSEQSLQAGDTLQANDYLLSAEDWK